jgi:hypothetical protein
MPKSCQLEVVCRRRLAVAVLPLKKGWGFAMLPKLGEAFKEMCGDLEPTRVV